MASITKRKDGRVSIQFIDGDKRRRTITAGKIGQRPAERMKEKIEALNGSNKYGLPIDNETARWLAALPPAMRQKLAKAGLIAESDDTTERPPVTLGPFLGRYIESRGDVKPATLTVYKHTKRCLTDFFGDDKPLADITAAAAKRFRVWLKTDQKLAANTISRRIGFARQFFRSAVDDELIERNPFDKAGSTTVKGNRSRDYFVSRSEADAVLEACPDLQWRLLFALSRYGGLRCPSEHLALRWGDIDWERGRMTVHSPKTEHHEGGECRIVPIFPELRPLLEAGFDEAPGGAEFVVTRYRDKNANLRTQLQKIIKRAGLKPWPKLFHNLRASRRLSWRNSSRRTWSVRGSAIQKPLRKSIICKSPKPTTKALHMRCSPARNRTELSGTPK